MRKFTRVVSPAILAIAAMALASGTALAAPTGKTPAAPKPAGPESDFYTLSTEIMPGMRYTSNTQDNSVVIQTGAGTLTTLGGQFQIKDPRGNTLLGAPFAVKPKAEAALETAAAPGAPVQRTSKKLIAKPVVDQATTDFNNALGVLSTQTGLAVTVGGLAGGAIGSIGGCVLGGTVGAAILPVFFLATGPAGCLVGLGVGGSVGTLAGSLLLGVPVGIASGVQMYNTLHEPATS